MRDTVSGRVDEAVVRICELGCARVREIIRALAQGEDVPEAAHLCAEERAALLAELQAIMAVYDRPE